VLKASSKKKRKQYIKDKTNLIYAGHDNDDNELPSTIARMPATTMAVIERDALMLSVKKRKRESEEKSREKKRMHWP